jgi:hypothetical protein
MHDTITARSVSLAARLMTAPYINCKTGRKAGANSGGFGKDFREFFGMFDFANPR